MEKMDKHFVIEDHEKVMENVSKVSYGEKKTIRKVMEMSWNFIKAGTNILLYNWFGFGSITVCKLCIHLNVNSICFTYLLPSSTITNCICIKLKG